MAWPAGACAAVLVALLGGCSDAVDPTIGTDRAFSLYGYLDPTADRQALRVVPIAPALGADTARAPLAAAVTSVERGTGRAAAWRDSVVTYADGSVGHVFVADYTPTPGATVDVTVAEAGAPEPRTASVTVEVPVLAASRVRPASVIGGSVSYPVEIDGVPNIIGGALRVFVTGFPGAEEDTTVIEIPTQGLDIDEVAPGDWVTLVPFLTATRDYLQSRGLSGRLALIEAEFSPFVANDAWAVPPGGLDLDRIVEPGTFSNVAGGFGFVGAGYEAPVRWVPSIATQSRAGFRVTGDPASLVTINEVSLTEGWVEFYNPTTEPVELSGYTVKLEAAAATFEITDAATVPPGGFFVFDTGATIVREERVSLLNLNDAEVTLTFVATDVAAAYGSFPDGRSLQLPRGGPNLFKGPLAPTRGGPNRIAFTPVTLNEVYTSGTEGWVEIYRTSPQQVTMQVASEAELIQSGASVVLEEGLTLELAEENGSSLVLSQEGGEVFLLASFPNLATGETVNQVVDYRVYGPQDPTRSIGSLPDGPSGSWRDGLVPTRGQPNSATGRLAAR